MKLIYKIFLLFFSIFYFSISLAQITNPDIKRTYHWYFGEYAGLDFSSGSATAVTNSAMYNDGPGTASISDTSGNLLFYTDGKNIWNKNHQQMPNGTGLISGAGSIQRVLIIPKPLSDSIYYIFHNWVSPQYTALYYSIVNINMEAGLGDVISKNNIVITSTNSGIWTTEKLAATKHKNDTDIWVMANQFNTNNFYAFPVTPAGVDTIPVISSIGWPDNYGVNTLKFSPSGQKVAIGFDIDGFEVLNFDNETGLVSNPIILTTGKPSQAWGLEFSPDESKLYMSEYYTDSITTKKLYQVDLSSGDSATIAGSLTIISSIDAYYAGNIQLASDGKLYIAKPFEPELGIISNPNDPGISCNYVDSGIYLSGKISGSGLPSFISSYFYNDSLNTIPESDKSKNYILIYPNPFNYSASVTIPFTGKINVDLYDMFGKKCEIKNQLIRQAEKTVVIIKRHDLSSGIYLLNVKYNNQSYSKKLIITD